jgi:nitrogen fixation protein FixH
MLVGLLAGCGEGAASDADGSSGDLRVDVATDPATPTLGRNALAIRVTDLDGAPIDDAHLAVDLEMPAHGHGSTEEPAIEALGQGRYRAFPVTFYMPGRWIVAVHAETDAAAGDTRLEVPVR